MPPKAPKHHYWNTTTQKLPQHQTPPPRKHHSNNTTKTPTKAPALKHQHWKTKHHHTPLKPTTRIITYQCGAWKPTNDPCTWSLRKGAFSEAQLGSIETWASRDCDTFGAQMIFSRFLKCFHIPKHLLIIVSTLCVFLRSPGAQTFNAGEAKSRMISCQMIAMTPSHVE